MKRKHWKTGFMLAFLALWSISATAAAMAETAPADTPLSSTSIQVKTPEGIVSVQLPLISLEHGELVVAEVNGDPIPLAELNVELLGLQAGEQQHSKHGNIHEILKRIVSLRLLEQEARNIGFDETPDFEKEVGAFKSQWLRTLLQSRQVKDIRPDEEEVAKLYKEMSTFVKLESVVFAKKKDAKQAVKEIKKGASYQDVVKKALQDKTAEGSLLGARSYSFDQLMPEVVNFAQKAKAGELSPIIPAADKFALVKMEEAAKTVESLELMEQARQKILAKKNLEVIRAYFDELKKKYAVINQELIDSLDYGADEPGLDALLKDKRIVIEIKDEAPITVADFSKEMESKLYHGANSKENLTRLNSMKGMMEDNILYKKLFMKEAMALELDKTEQFEKGVAEFERKTLFNTFVNKVIVPEAKVKEETARAYYAEHLSEYSSPKMLRLKSLVFDNATSAKDALDLLQQNTEFKWLSANAEHQVKKDTEGLLQFDSNILSLSGLSPEIQEVIGDAKDGDYRLYQDQSAGHFYVLLTEKVYPATPTAYSEVREAIAKDLFKKRIPELVEEWATKLRDVYEVKLFLVDASE
ncbi:MAG: peptidyl-prolyl cis-trans isomerase [Proteobacteria bacterium]|nr:peptidyl-prolyl cis-trans isomerase [Pseudomonadota bacterium]